MLKKSCCCICLSINKRTDNIFYRTDLLYFYEQLANFKVRDSECWMCYICQTRLQQCHRLQQLALQTRGLVDGLCRNKTDIDIGAIGSLLELSIYNNKNISITDPTADNIKEEPDIKTEQYNEDEIIEEQTVENTNEYEEDYAPVLKFEADDVSDSDAVCKQESLSVIRIDACYGSRVLELKLVKLSQSVIDKYLRQSPTPQQRATEEHIGKKGTCAGEQSVENEEKKAQYKSHNERMSCDICLKMFPTKSRLLGHICRTHTGEKRFTCDVCEKKFTSRGNLKKHLGTCTGKKPFNCNIRPQKFGKKCYLQAHLRTHTDERPYNCHICQKKFTLKGNLKKHLVIHSAEKPFNCHICQKKFKTRSHLKRHSLIIHTGEKPYSCGICQKKFKLSSNLKEHSVIHTAEKPFNCDICHKKFRLGHRLKTHLKFSHTGEKPHSCDICQKKFAFGNGLKIHLRIHTGEKPYSCYICQKKFTISNNLKKHLGIHTGERSEAV